MHITQQNIPTEYKLNTSQAQLTACGGQFNSL